MNKAKTLFNLLLNSAKDYPKKHAMVWQDNKLTYEEILSSVVHVAKILEQRYKIAKADKVAILLPNTGEYAISIFAINKIGAITVPVNIKLDAETMYLIMKNADVKLVITNNDLAKRFALEGKFEILTTSHGQFAQKNDEVQVVKFEGSSKDIAVIMYTSGTTAQPKGAMMTNGNFIFNCRSCTKGFGLKKSDVQLIVVPLFHVTGLNSQLIVGVALGNTLILLPEYHTAEVYGLIEKYKITVFIAVPAVLNLLIEKFGIKIKKLKSLRVICYAGAPMPVGTIKNLKTLLPRVKLHNFYGLTETSSIATLLADKYALITPDSVGTAPKGVSLIVNDSKGKIVKTDQIGELLVKGPNIVKGYYKDKEKTSLVFKKGWLHTGDIARIDSIGRVYLYGRKKEIINRGGEKIYPLKLEDKLYNHPKVLEAAIVGIYDRIFGESVKAFIVLKSGQRLTKKSVIKYCTIMLAKYEIPNDVVFLSKLPRNANGKVQKEILKNL